MKLYYFETPNARKACAVARHLDAPVEFVRVDLTKGEHKAPTFLTINPNGKVPALEDGEMRLWESAAIMAYLADKAGSDLWPKDARQIDVIRWLTWDAMHFSRHAATLFFEQVVVVSWADSHQHRGWIHIFVHDIASHMNTNRVKAFNCINLKVPFLGSGTPSQFQCDVLRHLLVAELDDQQQSYHQVLSVSRHD